MDTIRYASRGIALLCALLLAGPIASARAQTPEIPVDVLDSTAVVMTDVADRVSAARERRAAAYQKLKSVRREAEAYRGQYLDSLDAIGYENMHVARKAVQNVINARLQYRKTKIEVEYSNAMLGVYLELLRVPLIHYVQQNVESLVALESNVAKIREQLKRVRAELNRTNDQLDRLEATPADAPMDTVIETLFGTTPEPAQVERLKDKRQRAENQMAEMELQRDEGSLQFQGDETVRGRSADLYTRIRSALGEAMASETRAREAFKQGELLKRHADRYKRLLDMDAGGQTDGDWEYEPTEDKEVGIDF